MYRKVMSLSVAVLLVFCLAPASVFAHWEATPDPGVFPNTAVGESTTLTFTVQNTSTSELAYFMGAEVLVGEEFAVPIAPPVGTAIPAGEAIDIVVTFSPVDLGESIDYLKVSVQDGVEYVIIDIFGTGVEDTGEPVSVDEILEFFDSAVADGSLIGNGPGNSADGRLGALRNMIKAAGDLIAANQLLDACQQLQDAWERCDGQARPPEFVANGVEGVDAVGTLAGMIADLMAELGCL